MHVLNYYIHIRHFSFNQMIAMISLTAILMVLVKDLEDECHVKHVVDCQWVLVTRLKDLRHAKSVLVRVTLIEELKKGKAL